MSGCLQQRAKGLVHRCRRRQEEKRKKAGLPVSPQLLVVAHTIWHTCHLRSTCSVSGPSALLHTMVERGGEMEQAYYSCTMHRS